MKSSQIFSATVIKRFTLAILLGALSACGFQLRQDIQLPATMQRVHIAIDDNHSPIARDLAVALTRAGATVEVNSADGIAELSIPVNVQSTEVLSVSDAARVQEFIVRHRLEMSITGSDGKVLLDKTEINLNRDFSYDQTQALGAANEEALIKKELQTEMVRAVMNRIGALSS